jgi:DNA transformation protein and related proteins
VIDAEALKELFEPFGAVTVRSMFGGAGIYADGLCFAIASRGEVFLKVDAETQGAFEAAGSQAFVYEMQGKPKSMAFRRLVAEAYDDPEELKRWAGLGLEAARRAAAAKAKRSSRNKNKR